MKITLKKASELSRAAIAAAKAVEVKTHVGLSVYSTINVEEAVSEGNSVFNAAVERSLSLVHVGYVLREIIAEHNSEKRIDVLLTRVAEIDEQIARLTPLVSSTESYEDVSSDDLGALKRRFQQAKDDVANVEARRYGGSRETFLINLIDSDAKNAIADRIGVLKRKRAGFKDQLTALNFTTEIVLDSSVADILRSEKLID